MTTAEQICNELKEAGEKRVEDAPKYTPLTLAMVLETRAESLGILAKGYKKMAEEDSEKSLEVLKLMAVEKLMLSFDAKAVAAMETL